MAERPQWQLDAARFIGRWIGRALGFFAIGASFVVAGFFARVIYGLILFGWGLL